MSWLIFCLRDNRLQWFFTIFHFRAHNQILRERPWHYSGRVEFFLNVIFPLEESSGFFAAREGTIGPYESSEVATRVMDEFIETCKKLNSDGGRVPKVKSELSLNRENYSKLTLALEPDHWV